MKDAHKKPVRMVTPDAGFQAIQPIFSQNDFDKAIESKGYKVFIEKAVMCPCADLSTGASLPMCQNCGGSGWFYIEKRSTLAVVQSMNRRTKYINWSEQDRGTVSITLKGEDRVAFMDKVRLLEVESVFSQRLSVKRSSDDKIFGFLLYQALEIEVCYQYVGFDNKLTLLKEGVDFEVEEDKLLFRDDFELDEETGEAKVSVRYKYNPTYHIIDINREIVKTFSMDERFDEDKEVSVNAQENSKEAMPVNSVARKAHFLNDSANLSGESLFDNTPYDE